VPQQQRKNIPEKMIQANKIAKKQEKIEKQTTSEYMICRSGSARTGSDFIAQICVVDKQQHK
jgi:hypothetical protein